MKRIVNIFKRGFHIVLVKEYNLVFDKNFVKEYRKLDKSLQIEGDKKIRRLKINPEIGKPLKFFPNLYELHIRMYRIYYVVQEKEIRILLLSVLHKDEQEKFLRSLTKEVIKRIIEENS
jgi:mRNA-degrading endonuclease RelE of RelBE toxin-antitoxin system